MSLTENKHSGFYTISKEKSLSWIKEYNFNLEKYLEDVFKYKGSECDFNNKGFDLAKEVPAKTDNIYLFDSLCIHSARPRKNDTRISIDVRINPVDDFIDGYIGTGNTGAKFSPDGHNGYNKYSIKNSII